MIALFVGLALAIEPPARPTTTEASGDECSKAISLAVGEPAPCLGVLLGPPDIRYYLSTEDAYSHLRGLFRVETAVRDHELARAIYQKDFLTAELERQREPVPILQRPGSLVMGGVIVSLGLTLTAAYGLRAVGEGGQE